MIDKKIIGVSSDSLVKIYDINDNFIKYSFYNETKIKKVKLYYTKKDIYFNVSKLRYKLSEILRTN